MMTEAQLELLRDKHTLWTRAAREGPVDLRDYNRRAAGALGELLAIHSGDPQGEGAALRLLLRDLMRSCAEMEAWLAARGKAFPPAFDHWNACIDAASGYLAKDAPEPINEAGDRSKANRTGMA